MPSLTAGESGANATPPSVTYASGYEVPLPGAYETEVTGWLPSLALVNADRQANGAPAVQLDDWLTIVAWDHAVDMAVQGYYAHFDPHGLAPTTRSLLLGSMVMGARSPRSSTSRP